jgi:hypothetical protein
VLESNHNQNNGKFNRKLTKETEVRVKGNCLPYFLLLVISDFSCFNRIPISERDVVEEK